MATHIWDITADFSDQVIHPDIIKDDCDAQSIGGGCLHVDVNPKGFSNKVVAYFVNGFLNAAETDVKLPNVATNYSPAAGPTHASVDFNSDALIGVANINSLADDEVLGMVAGDLVGVPTSSFAGADANAVHVNASGEIAGLAEKTALVGADKLICEDSENSNAKVYVQVSNLPAGGVAYGTVAGTATEGNDTRVPTQAENDAMAGTNGAPSDANRYCTNSDPRLTDSRTPSAHTIASHDTSATGAQLDELVGAGVTALHSHAISPEALQRDGSVAMTGSLDCGGQAISNVKRASLSAEVDHGSVSTPTSIDFTAGSMHVVTLTADVLFTLDPPPASNPMHGVSIRFIQGGAGGHKPTFAGTNVHLSSAGATPGWSTAAGAVDIATGMTNGTTFWLFVAKDFAQATNA